MNSQDAQSSLDTIRRLQGRTREEIVRQMFPLPCVVISALGLFAGLGSTDLPRPWPTVGSLLGFGLYAGIGIVYAHWASVRRKPTGQEVGVYLALTAVLLLVFGISRIAAFFLLGVPAHGLLSQGAVAGAVTAVTYVAIMPLTRRVMKAIIQQDDKSG